MEYATIKGQTSYDVVSEMIESELYQNMTDEEKADAIKQAYQYAGHVAAQAINPEHESEAYVSDAKNAENDFGVSEAEYLLMREKYGSTGINQYRNLVDSGYGGTIPVETFFEVKGIISAGDSDGSGAISQDETTAALDSIGSGLILPGQTGVRLTNDQKAVMWQLQNKGWKWYNNPYSTSIGEQVYNALHPEDDDSGGEFTGLLKLPGA